MALPRAVAVFAPAISNGCWAVMAQFRRPAAATTSPIRPTLPVVIDGVRGIVVDQRLRDLERPCTSSWDFARDNHLKTEEREVGPAKPKAPAPGVRFGPIVVRQIGWRSGSSPGGRRASISRTPGRAGPATGRPIRNHDQVEQSGTASNGISG